MPERKSAIRHPLFNLRINRRDLLRGSIHGALAATAAYTATKAEKLLFADTEPFGFIEKIDDETRQKLLQFKPVTIAHNGADDFGRLNMSIEAGVDFVEADIRQFLGRLIVSHSEDSLALAWNESRRFLGFSGTIPYFGELVQELKPNSQKLFLEIKEDSLGLANIVLNEVYRNGLENRVSFFAKNWQTLDRISKDTGRKNNLFYTVGNYEELELFLNQQGKNGREGVSLNVGLAEAENIVRIRIEKIITRAGSSFIN